LQSHLPFPAFRAIIIFGLSCIFRWEVAVDWTSDQGRKLTQRLNSEMVAWLTTVRADGTPMPTPVWFLWDGNTFLIYTPPGSNKLKYINENPRAAINLNSNEEGDDVAIFTGEIRILPDAPPAIDNQAYIEKYRQGIKAIDMTPQTFSRDYSVALSLHPEKVRAW
jgi:PPOX class probable F420-dependent enzyme